MKSYSFILILICCLSCTDKENTKQNSNVDFLTRTVSDIILHKDNQFIEFSFLYDSLISTIPDKSEIKIEALLIRNGFELVDAGRGNYPPLGPRIVSKTYKKADCYCEVNKIYYSTTVDTLYQMSERIRCMSELEYKGGH